MPQARLPDIGHAYDAYRKKAIDNINNNHTTCIGSLYALNSLLDPEYQIEINTAEYEKRLNLVSDVKCNSCTELITMKEIKVVKQLTPLVVGIVSGTEYEKIWFCTKCQAENKLMNTVIVKKIPKEPFFLKVVPQAPMRKDGLMDRSTYNNKFETWAWIFLNELEAQMAKFRDDNWKRGDDQGEISDIDTSLEEEQVA